MTAKQSARARRKRHEEAAAWALKNRGGARSAADLDQFQAWLDRDPENRGAYEAAERLLGDARTAILSDPDLRDLSVEPRAPIVKKLIVAGLAVALASGAIVHSDGLLWLRADIVSDASEMPLITLSDGSMMQLNASSAVSYRFSGDTRTVVVLKGQAFFQVARDPNRLFVVEAGGGRTTALGTAFDVRLGAETTDVTVTEHAVSIASDNPAEPKIRLGEGRQAVYGRDGKVKDIRTTDVNNALAWRRGQLVVDNVPLADVVAEIDRHFGGRIFIASQRLAARRVSGTFLVINPDAAISFLQETLGITVMRMGPVVILHG